MKNKTLILALLSDALPLATYGIVFLSGLAPARLPDPQVFAPLFFFNAAGFALAVMVLSLSDRKPIDTSRSVNIAVLLAAIALCANSITVELIVHISILHKSQL